MNNRLWLITGGAGFIGGRFVEFLNSKGIDNIIIFDEITPEKLFNINKLKHVLYENKNRLFAYIKQYKSNAVCIHLGANSSTTCKDASIIEDNTSFTLDLVELCRINHVPLVYASSASVYGNKTDGSCEPLCLYAYSKYLVDNYLLEANSFSAKSLLVGLRFFNVCGRGESHKGSQASVIYNWFNENKHVDLSGRSLISVFNGENKRDFIDVEDVCKVIYYFASNPLLCNDLNGVYDVGTGVASDFVDIANIMTKRLNRVVRRIDMPEHLKRQYQVYTCANLTKLRMAGYKDEFKPLDKMVNDYLDYLESEKK